MPLRSNITAWAGCIYFGPSTSPPITVKYEVICDHAFFSQPTVRKARRARRGEGMRRDLLAIAKGLFEANARRGEWEKIKCHGSG